MNDESIILTGQRLEQRGDAAGGRDRRRRCRAKTGVINLLQLPGGSASQQVMLQVRIAEVNRRAVQELGVNFFSTAPRMRPAA